MVALTHSIGMISITCFMKAIGPGLDIQQEGL